MDMNEFTPLLVDRLKTEAYYGPIRVIFEERTILVYYNHTFNHIEIRPEYEPVYGSVSYGDVCNFKPSFVDALIDGVFSQT